MTPTVFATVGTHEQPFDRLLRELDALAARGALPGPAFAQTGYSTYVPRHVEHAPMLAPDEMRRRAREAAIVVTHGGPGTIMLALGEGKVPIVVPRRARFGEHVNDHQLHFVRRLERAGALIAVYDAERLGEAIARYDELRAALRPALALAGPAELARRLDEYCRSVIGPR